MQLPETPKRINELDLMARLASYAAGTASYLPDSRPLAELTREACEKLHAGLSSLEQTVGPLLDKVTAKEMQSFTAHDRKHALKVAHIMWHIIDPAKRLSLTPPEIGLLVSCAFTHDLGMFLSEAERETRLSPESDLWDRLEISPDVRKRIKDIQNKAVNETVPAVQGRLLEQLHQANEALLCIDNRERHATEKRYRGIFAELRDFHQKDPANIADIDVVFSFEGDAYVERLIDLCVSHNESADALVRRDRNQPDRPRFPRKYPVGSATVDLLFIAAALRVSDILDFDRERTPPVLFHYFLPSAISSLEDSSSLEWSKHLAISNWHIQAHEIVFRGRCRSHIVHHGIVHFCESIAEEIAATKVVLETDPSEGPLLALPSVVVADIHSEGYTYVPYKFELDDERIYRLLMGGAIYSDTRQVIRELLQNAVDACRLRDALTRLNDSGVTPNLSNRIVITYEEPTLGTSYPTLEVRDTGTGMDLLAINRWFLKVGRSFYNSPEFNKFRIQLRKAGFDFAPTSEFGIGFLSTFLLADKVDVETAMWEPLRGDTRRRVLEIHGPTRLIRLTDDENTGAGRFRGTRVKLTLTRGDSADRKLPLTWPAARSYLVNNCIAVPYRIHLRHVRGDTTEETIIEPQPLTLDVSDWQDKSFVKITVDDSLAGIKGEIAYIHPSRAEEYDRQAAEQAAVRLVDEETDPFVRPDEGSSVLVRGGFRVAEVPGLLQTYRSREATRAVLSLDWESRAERRYPMTNLGRTRMAETNELGAAVVRVWLSWLLEHVDELSEGFLDGYDLPMRFAIFSEKATWMERFNGYVVHRLAANSWYSSLKHAGIKEAQITEWTQSTGEALSRRTPWPSVFHAPLQDLVLPRVCKLLMGAHGQFYICPPKRGWIETLQTCNDYISKPVKWGCYVRYIKPIEGLLFYDYIQTRFLNEVHRARVDAYFEQEEVSELIESLRVLVDTEQRRQVKVSSRRLALLQKAQKHLGNLEVGNSRGRWRIDSFKLSNSA